MSTIVVMNLVSIFKNFIHEMYFWGFSRLQSPNEKQQILAAD